MTVRLKTKEIPEAKKILLDQQGWRCGICGLNLRTVEPKNICLDHCHVSGNIRGILCRSCNGSSGRILNFANRSKRNCTIRDWLYRMFEYEDYYEENPSGIWHPTHKTKDEKRVLRNKRAKKRRQLKKDKVP